MDIGFLMTENRELSFYERYPATFRYYVSFRDKNYFEFQPSKLKIFQWKPSQTFIAKIRISILDGEKKHYRDM